MNKFNGQDVAIVTNINSDKQPMGIAVVSNDTNNCWLNPCLSYKCNENYQKIITNDGKCACICMRGYIYDQRLNNCVAIKVCPRTQFRCLNGIQCIQQESVCDKIKDCIDSSDEANCPLTVDCGPMDKFFKCKNDSRSCLPIEMKCNRRRDCSDNSDELDCSCASLSEFQCLSNNRCIDL